MFFFFFFFLIHSKYPREKSSYSYSYSYLNSPPSSDVKNKTFFTKDHRKKKTNQIKANNNNHNHNHHIAQLLLFKLTFVVVNVVVVDHLHSLCSISRFNLTWLSLSSIFSRLWLWFNLMLKQNRNSTQVASDLSSFLLLLKLLT